MITVKIPHDKDFNFIECEKLFNLHKVLINDNQNFLDIVKNTLFYSFFYKNRHIGCIYYYTRGKRLFVNAFANRYNHEANIKALKQSFNWFNCDIYAETQHKTAILCLYKCGFKKIGKNIYKYER